MHDCVDLDGAIGFTLRNRRAIRAQHASTMLTG
jgi:hypothetical protein